MLNKNSLRLAAAIRKQLPQVALESDFNIFSEAIRYSSPLIRRAAPSLESAVADVGDTAAIVIESEGVSQHEGAVSDAVERMVIGITNQFDYIRKTVRPFISKATDRLMDSLKASTPCEYSIREFVISEFLTSETASNLFKEVPYQNYYKISSAPAGKDKATILQDISTNIPEIDEALAKVVADLGDSAVEAIYNAIFCNTRPSDNTAISEAVRRLFVQKDEKRTIGIFTMDEIDFLMVAYFIAEGYLDNPVDGTGLSLPEYQTYVRQVMLNVGSTIARLVKFYNEDLEKGVVILRAARGSGIFYDAAMGEILVLSENYRRALESGLDVETVIGASILPTRSCQTLDSINANKIACKQAYQAADNNRQRQSRLQLVDRLNSSLRVVLLSCVEDEPEESFPSDFNRAAAAANAGEVTAQLKAYLANWDTSEELEIYDLMSTIICSVIFPFTDAKAILDCMEETVADEDIEPRFAAYYAAVRYISRWMVANFHIAKDEK